MFVVSNQTMREIDAASIATGIAGVELMERAGMGAARAILARPSWLTGCALIVCGKGNNGGDGLVVARLLAGEGHDVEVLLLAPEDEFKGDAATNLQRARESGLSLRVATEDAAAELRALERDRPGRLLVDAILGTGFTPPLSGRLLDVIDAMNESDRRIVALDCPSGLDGGTGAVDPTAVAADLTITFGFPKWGLYLSPGRPMAGKIELVDLEYPPRIVSEQIEISRDSALYVEAVLAASWWKERPIDAHKYSVGSLLATGGGRGMSGAMSLACLGALRSGAGLVEAVVPGSQRAGIDTTCIEVLVHGLSETEEGSLAHSCKDEILARAQRHAAVLLGPGAGSEIETARLLVELSHELEKPLVIDADGINAFARLQLEPRFSKPCVLTPHTGELARLLSMDAAAIEARRVEVLGSAAARLGAVILHKGAPTMVAAPDGAFAVIASGGPALASAGTGDVLAGSIAALLAGGYEAFEAACLGAHLHGRAGERVTHRTGEAGLLARDLLDELGPAGRELEAQRR